MKKMQRILALVGVILLVLMYASTLFFSLSDSPNADGWFRASIYCTIVVPVFLYVFTLVTRYLIGKGQEIEEERKAEEEQNAIHDALKETDKTNMTDGEKTDD